MTLDTKKRYYVYEWFIVDTDEVFYVGKGTGKRYKTKKRENQYFMKMLNSHECDSRIVFNNLSEKEAFELEIVMIAMHRYYGARLTNVQDGGENPPVQYGPKSELQKAHMSEAMRRFYENHPEEKEKQSEKMKEFFKTEEGVEFRRRSVEAKKTDKYRKECSARVQGFCKTTEYRKKVSDGLIAYYKEHDSALLGGNNHRAQGVAQYSIDGKLIRTYKTITEASNETGATQSKITAVAKGRRKTAGGYVWKYTNDRHNPGRKTHAYDVSKDKNAKPVIQCDKNGNEIKTYPSVAEAARINGFERTNIFANLSGRTKSAYGFTWKYK